MQKRRHDTGAKSSESKQTKLKKVLWPVLFLLIAAASIAAVSAQMKQDSLAELGRQLLGMDPMWSLAAIVSMFGFILFEGISLRAICQSLGIRPGFKHCCEYAAADIYFSAITPSATGGQPASVLLMHQDGFSVATATAALLINLTMCAFATFLMGAVCFGFNFRTFLRFGVISRILIAVGFLMQLVTALVLYLMVWHETMLQNIASFVIRFAAKIHLVRNQEEKLSLLAEKMNEYRQVVRLVADRKHYLVQAFACNFLQRCSQLCITMFVFRAMGISGASMFDIWATQGFVVMGSNYVPIPGGMGIADILLLNGFGAVMSSPVAAQLELISRSLSFYLCILLCGGALVLRLFVRRSRAIRYSRSHRQSDNPQSAN